MASTIEKTFHKVWDDVGKKWIEIYNPSSADLIYVDDQGTTLEQTLEAIDTAFETTNTKITTHVNDSSVHVSSGDKSKLSKLANDPDATYATKAALSDYAEKTDLDDYLTKVDAADEYLSKTDADTTYATKSALSAHASATDDGAPIHLTKAQVTKLQKLAADADATYATKEECAASNNITVCADITAMNGIVDPLMGQQAWVKDPTDDDVNITDPGTAIYIWDGSDWNFVFQFTNDIDTSVDWTDIIDGPDSTAQEVDDAVAASHTHSFVDSDVEDAITKKHAHASSLSEIEDAVAKKHAHSNKTVIDKLTDVDGDLAYDGIVINTDSGNKTYLGSSEPENPNHGDTWYEPIS